LNVLNLAGMGTNVNWWKSTNVAVNTAQLETTANVFNIADRLQEVTCTTYSAAYTLDGNALTSVATQDTGYALRQVRFSTAADTFVTVSCGWQKKGLIKTKTDAALTVHKYVECQNTTNNSAFAADRFSGVPLKWSNLFNVHKCTNASSIPVIVAKLTDGVFASIDTHAFTLGDVDKPVIFCLDTTSIATVKSGLGLDAGVLDTKINPMDKCGLAAVDLNKFSTTTTTFDNTGYGNENANTDNSTDHVGCIVCKPGYKPTIGSNLEYARKCAAIEFCNQSGM